MTAFATVPGKTVVHDLAVDDTGEMDLVPEAKTKRARVLETIYISCTAPAALTIRVKRNATVKMVLLDAVTIGDLVYQITDYPRPLENDDRIVVESDTADAFWISAIVIEQLTIDGNNK